MSPGASYKPSPPSPHDQPKSSQMTSPSRRAFTTMTAALALAAASRRAMAQPTGSARRILVAFAPGGTSDLLWRAVAAEAQIKDGRPWVVENVPGANGLIAATRGARSKPDGMTLAQVPAGLFRTPGASGKTHAETLRNLTPVAIGGRFPVVLLARTDLAASDLKSHLQGLKSSMQPLVYASTGNGSTGHLFMEWLAKPTGVETLHVPFSGSAPAVTAVLSGDVATALIDPLPAIPHIASGKLKVLAISSPSRDSRFPNVKTFTEQGFSGLSPSSWLAVFAPAATEQATQGALANLIREALASPAVREACQRGYIEDFNLYLASAKGYIEDDAAAFQRVAASLNLRQP